MSTEPGAGHFSDFFTKENIELIHGYGSHRLNPLRMEAKYETIRGQPRVVMQHWSEKCQLLIGQQLYDYYFEWPQPSSE